MGWRVDDGDLDTLPIRSASTGLAVADLQGATQNGGIEIWWQAGVAVNRCEKSCMCVAVDQRRFREGNLTMPEIQGCLSEI